MFTGDTIDTPIGQLVLNRIECVRFGMGKLRRRYEGRTRERSGAYPQAVRQLYVYFWGLRREFSFPMQLAVSGFQRRALVALLRAEYGQTISYKELANMAGSAGPLRAAGTACAGNPRPIVIPCQRLLKSDGTLGGFGGGLEIKKSLLDLEQATNRK